MKLQFRMTALLLAVVMCLCPVMASASEVVELGTDYSGYMALVSDEIKDIHVKVFSAKELSKHLINYYPTTSGSWSGMSSTIITPWDDSDTVISLTANSANNDPQVGFVINDVESYVADNKIQIDPDNNVTPSVVELKTELYPYIVITFQANTTSTMQLFLSTSGGVRPATAAYNVQKSYAGSVDFQYLVFNPTASVGWTGDIYGFRFDFTTNGTASMNVDSIIFCSDEETANQLGKQRVAARELNETLTIRGSSLMGYADTYHNIEYGYVENSQAVRLTVADACKYGENHKINSYIGKQNGQPYLQGKNGNPDYVLDVHADFDLTSLNIYANDYNYLVINYRVPTENHSDCIIGRYLDETTPLDGDANYLDTVRKNTSAAGKQLGAEFFLTVGAQSSADKDGHIDIGLHEDEFYTSAVMDLTQFQTSSGQTWNGQIKKFRIDCFADHYSPIGDSMYIDSISFCKTKEQAEALSKEQHGQANRYGYAINMIENGTNVQNMPADVTSYYTDSENEYTYRWTNVPTREGYTFLGWATTADATNGDPTFLGMITEHTVSGSMNLMVRADLYAIWQENTSTISYQYATGCDEAFGTITPAFQKVGRDTSLVYDETSGMFTEQTPSALATPAYGYKFIGWYSDAACSTEAVTTDALLIPSKETNTLWPVDTVDSTASPIPAAAYYAKFELALSGMSIQVTDAIDDHTFLFNVKGTTGTTTADIDLTVAVNGNSTVTLAEMPVGSYTVSEVSGWTWRYAGDQPVQSVNVDGSNPIAKFTYTNPSTKWLDDNDYNIQ